MTILEALKQLLGSKADEEVDTTTKPDETDTGKEDETKEKEDDTKEKEDDTKEKEETVKKEETKEKVKSADNEKESKDKVNDRSEDNKDKALENKDNSSTDGGETMELFEDGWFNSETGEIDESKIKNQEVLSAIQSITGRYKKEKEDRMIADSLNDELKNYSLNVSEDTLRKVLDMTNVKIDKDGKVVGIKEALENLKTAEPGFFKDKEKESNPLNEGFNPVEKKNTDSIGSFSQAFKLMEEIS